MPPSPVAPAPTTVWISSMNRMMRPLLDVTCHVCWLIITALDQMTIDRLQPPGYENHKRMQIVMWPKKLADCSETDREHLNVEKHFAM